MNRWGGVDNQALIATLSRVKAVSQLSAVALQFVCAKFIVSHDDLNAVVTSGGASTPLSPAGFVGSA